MIEGSWLCLVLVLSNLKRLEEDKLFYKLFYNEEEVSSPKLLKHFFQEFVTS